ncbi:MAG: glycosyl transferase GT17 family protein [Bacteroidales bacterium]|nr:glycosyl transferase GT17 family protein [Bacteroidales bacterium]MCM1414570.1 glycosyl transferase GT17 family protein [bacterium]MCM1422620.1 glycosyl transferase GT17 family protein [bacterium]
MIFDCIPFFNELDILKLRMQILAPLVDYFVLEEAAVTFSGEPKEMVFAKNRVLFSEFEDKIRYVAVEDSPMEGVTTHERDKYQKNQLIRALADAKPEDIIIFSDVDEIPDPDTLARILRDFDPEKIYHFAQRMFYCFLNMEEVSGNLLSITGEFPGVEKRQWLGTKVCSFAGLPAEGIVFLREVSPTDPRSVRVPAGGWHFGYMGGDGERDVAKRIGVKVQAAAHQEYNNKRYLNEAVDRLLCGEDIFDRDARFVRVEIDESFPVYLRQHMEEYDFLIAPALGRTALFVKRTRLFLRQCLRRLRGIAARLLRRS